MEQNKEAKFNAVIKATLELVRNVDIDGMSISRIARNSGVSRAWIYKYIGKDNDEVLKVALKVFADEYASMAQMSAFKDEELLFESIHTYSIKLMEQIKVSTVGMDLYFAHITKNNLISDTIQDLEKKYLSLLGKNFKDCFHLPKDVAFNRAEAFHYARMGYILRYLLKFKDNKNLSWEADFIKEFKYGLQKLLF